MISLLKKFHFVRELLELEKETGLSKQEMAERMATLTLPSGLAYLARLAPTLIVLAIWIGSTASVMIYVFSVPTLLTSMGLTSEPPTLAKVLLYSLAPVVFALSFVVISGAIGWLSRPGIRQGKFPRAASHPIYALRRVYGTAWTQVYYFKPLYSVFLAIPFGKRLLFRLFGFSGPCDFTVYPDSWIRDLPLLKIGRGVYLANRCTVGTNLCLNDGTVLVGSCEFDDQSLVGHLAIFGLGCRIGKASEIGVGSALGIRATLGDGVTVAPKAVIYHGVEISHGAKIGACAVIGTKARIGEGVDIPMGAAVLPGSNILTQADADRLYGAAVDRLQKQKDELVEGLRLSIHELGRS